MKHRIINEIFDWDSSRFGENGLLSALRLQTTKHFPLWFCFFVLQLFIYAIFSGLICWWLVRAVYLYQAMSLHFGKYICDTNANKCFIYTAYINFAVNPTVFSLGWLERPFNQAISSDIFGSIWFPSDSIDKLTIYYSN